MIDDDKNFRKRSFVSWDLTIRTDGLRNPSAAARGATAPLLGPVNPAHRCLECPYRRACLEILRTLGVFGFAPEAPETCDTPNTSEGSAREDECKNCDYRETIVEVQRAFDVHGLFGSKRADVKQAG